jgi:hypothetical protein
MAKMLRPEDIGRTIAFVANMPPHVCVNEILISPTWNRLFLGMTYCEVLATTMRVRSQLRG